MGSIKKQYVCVVMYTLAYLVPTTPLTYVFFRVTFVYINRFHLSSPFLAYFENGGCLQLYTTELIYI